MTNGLKLTYKRVHLNSLSLKGYSSSFIEVTMQVLVIFALLALASTVFKEGEVLEGKYDFIRVRGLKT